MIQLIAAVRAYGSDSAAHITYPSSIEAGDLLILVKSLEGAPAYGFSLEGLGWSVPVDNRSCTPTVGTWKLGVAYKTATGAESGTVDFSGGAYDGFSFWDQHLLVYRAPGGVTIDVVGTAQEVGATTAGTALSITPTTDSITSNVGVDVLYIAGTDGSGSGTYTWAAPSGFVADVSTDAAFAAAIVARAMGRAGVATGAVTGTSSTSGFPHRTVLLAIKQSVVSTGFLFRSASSDAGTASPTTTVVPMPSGLTNGDLLTAVVMTEGATVTTPSGWSVSAAYTDNAPFLYAFSKIAASEGINFPALTLSGSSGYVVTVLAHSATYGFSPQPSPAFTYDSTADTSITAGSVSLTSNALVLGLFAADLSTIPVSWTVPDPLISRATRTNSSSNIALAVFDNADMNGGATGDITATTTVSATSTAVLLPIYPVTVGGGLALSECF